MKAIIAVAVSMLTALATCSRPAAKTRTSGAPTLTDATRKLAKRLVRRLEELGLKVTVPQAA